MAKIFKWFVNILFIAIIVVLLGYFVLRVTDNVEIYVVKTGSMEEKIHVGDYILIYRKNSYNIGDVVTYTSKDGFITHRIVRKDGNKIITKGDANNAEDSEILESTIVGKVIISGGILNIIINYKYVIVCILISLYLFSCYFEPKNKEIVEVDTSNEINTDLLENELGVTLDDDITSSEGKDDNTDSKSDNETITESTEKKSLVDKIEIKESEAIIDVNNTDEKNKKAKNSKKKK